MYIQYLFLDKMEILIWTIILIPFLWINYHIIKVDFREKRIPNTYLIQLLYLIPFTYIFYYYFWYFNNIEFSIFILQLFLSLVVCFSLFHFWLWWAGDTKYLLVLSLFIPQINILIFVFCIAVTTLIYLIWYFIWFWIGPNLWIRHKRNTLYKNIWKIKTEKSKIDYHDASSFQKFAWIIMWLNVFLILFIVLRLIRLDFILYLQNSYNISIFDILYENNWIYILIFLWLLLLLWFKIIKEIWTIYKNVIQKRSYIFYWFSINILWWTFILYEYSKAPHIFMENIILIVTLYLGIYILIQVALFAYKIVFIINEEELVHINNLKEWMLINRNYLYDIIKWKQKVVSRKDIKNINKLLKQDDIEKINKLYNTVNNYIINSSKNNQTVWMKYVQIQKTSPFSNYIFLWYIWTILLSYNTNIF